MHVSEFIERNYCEDRCVFCISTRHYNINESPELLLDGRWRKDNLARFYGHELTKEILFRQTREIAKFRDAYFVSHADFQVENTREKPRREKSRNRKKSRKLLTI